MNEKQFNICIGKIMAGKALDEDDAHEFVDTLSDIESLLDDGDQDDVFGTEGWRHCLGWN